MVQSKVAIEVIKTGTIPLPDDWTGATRQISIELTTMRTDKKPRSKKRTLIRITRLPTLSSDSKLDMISLPRRYQQAKPFFFFIFLWHCPAFDCAVAVLVTHARIRTICKPRPVATFQWAKLWTGDHSSSMEERVSRTSKNIRQLKSIATED